MRRFLLTAIFAVSAFAFAADQGGVSTGNQEWDGNKILANQGMTNSTLSDAVTLDLASTRFQRMNPNGSHRDVTLPAVRLGLWYFFINSAGAANNLVIKNDAGSTIVTIQQNEVGWVSCSSSAWSGAAFGAAFGGGLQADGSVAGATGQAQDFGTNGIKADVIAESTGAAGVTIDGVVLKDSAIATLNSTNVDAGASGTAGSVDVFPTTAAKGKIAIVAADSAGNTTTTITNASQTGAATYTIPDAGTGDFVMTTGTQTLSGTKTITTLNSTNIDAGASGTAGSVDVFPTTAAKGKIALVAADSTGNTTTTITNAAQAGAVTYTIPDAGGSADFMMSLGTTSAKTITTITNTTLNSVNGDFGSSGVAGSVDVFPTTAANGKIAIVCADIGGNNTLTITNAAQTGARTYTIPDAGASSEFVMLAGAQAITGVKTMSGANVVTHAPTGLKIQDSDASHLVTIAPGDEADNRTLSLPVLGGAQTLVTLGNDQTFSGAITFNATAGKFVRASQRLRFSGGWKVGGTAGFITAAADNVFAATCPASQTSAKLIVPIGALKVGSIITAFGLLGQVESAGNNVTVDADLRRSTTVAADFTDNSISTITQIAVTGDTAIDSAQDKAGLSYTTLQTEMYYVVVTVTTNADTDVDIRGVTLVVTEQ